MDSPNIVGSAEAADPPKTCYALLLREDYEGDELLGVYDTRPNALAAMHAHIAVRRGVRGSGWVPDPKNPDEQRQGCSSLRVVAVPVNALPGDW